MARFRIMLYLVLLPFFLSANTAYGERSFIENGTLIIPRIDIAGEGALQLTFNLAFEQEVYFDLVDITEASLSVANSATFHADVWEIEVFEIEHTHVAVWRDSFSEVSSWAAFVHLSSTERLPGILFLVFYFQQSLSFCFSCSLVVL